MVKNIYRSQDEKERKRLFNLIFSDYISIIESARKEGYHEEKYRGDILQAVAGGQK